MERKNSLSNRMSDISANSISTINSFSSPSSISTLSSLKVKHSFISSVTLSTLRTVKTVRTPIYNSTIVTSLTASAIQDLQIRAKTDHSALGQAFNEFTNVFTKYNTTTDPTEKAAWLVIAQNRLNELQATYGSNSMSSFISTITNVV